MLKGVYRGLHTKLLHLCKNLVTEAYSSWDTFVSLYKHAAKEDFEIREKMQLKLQRYTFEVWIQISKLCNIEKIY